MANALVSIISIFALAVGTILSFFITINMKEDSVEDRVFLFFCFSFLFSFAVVMLTGGFGGNAGM